MSRIQKAENCDRNHADQGGRTDSSPLFRRRWRMPFCFLLICIFIVSGCGKGSGKDGNEKGSEGESGAYTLNEFYFDTVISIRFDTDGDGQELIEGCRKICDEIQQTFSRTDEDSELYAVNHRDTDRVEVSKPLAELIQVGLDYYEISKGRFDITIAPLSDLWDFKSEEHIIPSEVEIQSALRRVDASAVHVECEGSPDEMEAGNQQDSETETEADVQSDTEIETDASVQPDTETKAGMQSERETDTINHMTMDSDTQTETDIQSDTETEMGEAGEEAVEPEGVNVALEETDNDTGLSLASSDQERWFVRFDREDTMIDLGALVKGYAADCLADYLKSHGVTSGLINLGGNVYAIGVKEDGSSWNIGIRKPFDTGVVDTVEVKDLSVVSSGVYERCFEVDGVLYHHILDPKTGYPVNNGLWEVSIISESSLTGDALSTTCMAIGLQEASDLIRSMDGVSAIFVNDQLKVISCS